MAASTKAKVGCYPPLGKRTVVPFDTRPITFTVLVCEPNVRTGVEVNTWHSVPQTSEWRSLVLERSKHDGVPFVDGQCEGTWYTGTLFDDLPGPGECIEFTYRFRLDASQPWQWVRELTGINDGRIAIQNEKTSNDINDYIGQLNAGELNVTGIANQASDTSVWILDAPAVPANGNQSRWSQYAIGVPRDVHCWSALVRHSTPWLGPRHGEATLANEEALMCSFLREDGLNVVILGYSGDDGIGTVLRGHEGLLVLSGRNDHAEARHLKTVVGVGRSLESSLSAVIDQAKKMMAMNESKVYVSSTDEEIDYRETLSWVDDWTDGLTFCTWNSLGIDLTEAKLLEVLQKFRDIGIRFTNLIIDDGWQSVDDQGSSDKQNGCRDFEAHSKGFPKGLKHTISSVRRRCPEIKHIAVWHAILGYWAGISPHGAIAQRYKTRTVSVRCDAQVAAGSILVVDVSDVDRMYNDFYSFLVHCGIDAVKTDAQFVLDELTSPSDRLALITAYHNAWHSARTKFFGSRAIASMSQTPANVFKSQIPAWSPLSTRTSDDFYPHEIDSHAWHIFCNAHNAVLTSYLEGAVADWDMFQTHQQPWAGFHAAARVLSGGPITITDLPGETDLKLLNQVTATTPSSGERIALRPDVPGRARNGYQGIEKGTLEVVAANDGTGFMGLFGCRSNGALQQEAMEVVHLKDFLGLGVRQIYVVRSSRYGWVSRVMDVNEGDAVVAVDLGGEKWAWEILCAHPVTRLDLPITDIKGQPVRVDIAPLGLLGHMVGAVALVASSVILSDRDNVPSQTHHPKRACCIKISVQLKALGHVGIYLGLGHQLCPGLEWDLQGERPGVITVILERECLSPGVANLETIARKGTERQYIISIDLETAWDTRRRDEIGDSAGKGDIVDIVVLINLKGVLEPCR